MRADARAHRSSRDRSLRWIGGSVRHREKTPVGRRTSVDWQRSCSEPEPVPRAKASIDRADVQSRYQPQEDHRTDEAGTQRYKVGTDTPRFRATSLGGTPLASNFFADSIRLSVLRRSTQARRGW